MKKQIVIVLLLISTIAFSQKSRYTTYRVSENETITSIARKLGVTPYDLLKLNPDAKDGINIDEEIIVPKKTFEVKNDVKVVKKTTSIPQGALKFTKSLKDSIKNGYLYHTVKPYETLYSLARKYKVSKRKARKLNKLNRKSNISVGQVLKFPTKLKDTCPKKKDPITTVVVENNENFLNYRVKAQDTLYQISKMYKVTEEELFRLNPNLKNGLKEDDVIKIPLNKKGENNVQSSNSNEEVKSGITYKMHTVKAKEGFFRLKQLYGFSKEELIKINPEIKDGLKLGMIVKIPVKAEDILMVEGDIHGKSLNVLMMLPFNTVSATSFNDETKAGKILNKTTDFYMGSLMALDDLKAKGLSANVKVVDTKNDVNNVDYLLKTMNVSNLDVVIGPLLFKPYKRAVHFFEKKNIPVISPISPKDHSVINSKNVISNTAKKADLEERIFDFMVKNYTNQNIIIVSGDLIKEKNKVARIKKYLQRNDSIKSFSVIELKDGYIKRELLEKNIKSKKENWVIVTTDKKNKDFKEKFAEVIGAFGGFGDEFNITLFALKKPGNLNDENMKIHLLNRLKFHYPAVAFYDDNNINVFNFKQNYKSKYGVEPSDFAFKGYDTTYDALMRLANNRYDFSKAFEAGKSKRLNSKYKYINTGSKGLYNSAIFIVKYENFELKEVD